MSRFFTRPLTEIERALRACRGSFALVAALSFCTNLLALTMPLYLLHVYDHVLASRSLDTLLMLSIIAVAAILLTSVLEGLRKEMLARVGTWLDDVLQPTVLAAAVDEAQRNNPTGASQAWRDLANLRSFFGGSAAVSLFDLPWTPIFVLAMVLLHPLLGLFGIIGAVVLFLLALANEGLTRRPLGIASAAIASTQHRLDALLRNAEAISAMGMLPGVARMLQKEQMEAREAQRSANQRSAAIQSVSKFVRMFTQILVMATATWLVINRDVSPAAIFVCSILLGRALGPVESAIGTWKAVTAVRLGYQRLHRMMTQSQDAHHAMELPPPVGRLDIETVSYLPPGADYAVVRRVNLSVQPGEVIGVIGPSGAGKSTLGRLIAGTLQPSAGHVRLDGADIAIWLAAGGHRHLGYLPQNVELFDASVRENISRLQQSDPEPIIAAAKLVGLHDTIMRLPRGYDTNIGEGGMRLSGGQRQRVGLARAFFGEPKLVVLDEPNAALDAEGEEALRVAVETMRARGTTIVIIAQRLGILSAADKVLILNGGAIDAFGDRRDVVAKIKLGHTAIPVKKQPVINGSLAQVPANDTAARKPGPSAAPGAAKIAAAASAGPVASRTRDAAVERRDVADLPRPRLPRIADFDVVPSHSPEQGTTQKAAAGGSRS